MYSELKIYKDYKKEKRRLELEIEAIWTELSGFKAIRYDQDHNTNVNWRSIERRKLELIERKAELEKKLEIVKGKMKDIELVVHSIEGEDGEILDYVILGGHTQIQAAKKFYMERSTICKRMKKIIATFTL